MAIEWLAGNRLRGTTAERPALGLPSGSVGGWVEIDRTTLGSAGDTISVTSLSNKRYYMWLVDTTATGGNVELKTRANNDTGSNYAFRYSSDGGSDTAQTGYTHSGLGYYDGLGAGESGFTVGYTANLSGKEKLTIGHHVSNKAGTGAGTAPNRVEAVGKWVNTSSALNRIDYYNDDAGDFTSGSEVVVLGWDPGDSHTTNFWEELASVTSTSASDTVDTGSFSQKKYLCVQIYNPAKPTGSNTYAYFNNVTTGGTHSGRSNTNGTNPATGSANSDYQLTGSNGSILNHDPSDPDSGTTPMFTNMFVINNADKEKLSIVHSVSGWSSTTGAGQAPARHECVGKWAKTDQAITSVQCGGLGTNGMGAGSIIKVWGAD